MEHLDDKFNIYKTSFSPFDVAVGTTFFQSFAHGMDFICKLIIPWGGITDVEKRLFYFFLKSAVAVDTPCLGQCLTFPQLTVPLVVILKFI